MKIIFILILSLFILNATTFDIIKMDKRLTVLENKVNNLENYTILMNENLKRIDFNFQKIVSILDSFQYKTDLRIKKVQIKTIANKSTDLIKDKTIFKVLNDTYLYKDFKGKIKLNKLYKGELIEISNCVDCEDNLECLCKVKNKKAYIKKKNLK